MVLGYKEAAFNTSTLRGLAVKRQIFGKCSFLEQVFFINSLSENVLSQMKGREERVLYVSMRPMSHLIQGRRIDADS